mgnify:CR=1 FL=1
MPWEKQYDPGTVLDRAMHQFWQAGYAASSISDLVAATGINRASLYAGFGGKRELFLAALRRYDERERARFLARLGAENPPREAILAAFAAAAHGRDGAPAGCLLVTTAQEMAPHDEAVQALVTDSFAALRDFFADRVRAAQAEGSVPPARPPGATADALLALFLGLRTLHRAGVDPARREAVLAQAGALLE